MSPIIIDEIVTAVEADQSVKRVPGVVIGIVTEIDEPGARVRLKFPVLSEDDVSEWARIAVLMAGDDAGAYFLPEAGDEVLVAFEHGDIRYPYVVGYLWGKQHPPRTDRAKRTLRSRAGHEIEMDDTKGSTAITIKTPGGHVIQMKDGPGTPTLTVDATAAGEIEVKCNKAKVTANQEITAMAGTKIELTSGANLNITAGANVTLSAGAGLTVNAPLATFAGIIQAQAVQTTTLIASSVISSVYTPGVGNIW